ncbi:MAG TPA: hypothetical protein VMI53_12955 [Opitutaceae bacterium]|nr:hypothetical protein [Opitutaceae bacterium]
MKTKIILPVLALALAGCQHMTKESAKAPAPPPVVAPPAPVAGTELDQNNMEQVRLGESLKAYPVGRLVDPNDPEVMHEAHTVYRREAGANWNLNPNAPTVVPLGPVLAVADPAKEPNPLPAELEQKIAEQSQLMASLIEQNEALSAQLAKLSHDIADLRQKSSAVPGKDGAR